MNDLIQQLAQKPPCLSYESRRQLNTRLVLEELEILAKNYPERFFLNDLENPGEFIIRADQNYAIFLNGPSIRRNLKYFDIGTFDSETGQMTYTLTTLPPISWRFQLDVNYPTKPEITYWFDSAWLPPYFFDLLEQNLLEVLKARHRNSLTRCCEFLNSKALSILFSLGDPKALVINAVDIFEDKFDRLQFVETLVDFEEEMRERQFAAGTYECDICTDEFRGSDCFRLRACGHIYCKQCLSDSITADIESGKNSGSPGCPGCDSLVHPVEIRRIVAPDIYERYESLLLNRTLSEMPNMVECPVKGCDTRVMLDDDFTEGVCTVCRFHFCAKCRQAFHIDTACVEGPLANLTPNEARDLVERYNNAGEQGQQMMDKRYGRLNILKLIDEVATNTYINSNCKPCPNCKSPIQKFTGCNRVMCTKCRKNFCWACLVVIESSNPYDHFRKGCKL